MPTEGPTIVEFIRAIEQAQRKLAERGKKKGKR